MYILFEEYQYESHLVGNILKDIYVLQNVNKKVCLEYVGYFYNPRLRDCVFILPKVLLTEDEKLSGVELPSGKTVSPEQVLTPQSQEALTKEYRKFIYEFSVWVYRALCMFHKANPKSKTILYKHLLQTGNGRRQKPQTYLDVILSLIKFNLENRDFVLLTTK
ncbi:MAG: restriction endonuclease, partial [Prevotella sp.]|nr:restriction endonuclease [Prevotella sp.]